MKAKALVALLFGALLLSACNLTASNKRSNGNQVASSNKNVDKESTLRQAMANLSSNKQSMTTAVDGKNYGSIYFTDKGYTETYDGESGGVVYNGQGWFKYTITNNQIVLGGVVSVNNLSHKPYVSGMDIALLGQDIYQIDAQDKKKFTSNDPRLLKLGAGLLGLEDQSFDTAALLVGEETITYTFTVGTQKVEYCFSSFGVSTNSTLDRFIANPTQVNAPTAFDSGSHDYIVRIMGNDANKLPFPSFASYAFMTDYSIADREFVMVEPNPSRNDVISYGNQLTAKGFVEDKSASITTYTLQKSGDASRYYKVECEYRTGTELNDSTLPFGAFIIRLSRQYIIPQGTSVGATYIANRWNENVDAAGKSDRRVSYDAEGKKYSLVGFFGEYSEATEVLVTAMADSLLQYMPEEVFAETAGFGDPAEGYPDLIGNGSAYYLFYGYTANKAVSVELTTCVYSGHLAVILYIYNA